MIAVLMIYLAMASSPYPDLIARQGGLNTVIAGPLTADQQQTVIEAMWKRELNYHIRDFAFGETNLRLPRPHQQMALHHLLHGGALRAGDVTAMHGSLLSALQPNTYKLAKEWQGFMKCVGDDAKKDPSCVGY